jgi:hypothetical protein
MGMKAKTEINTYLQQHNIQINRIEERHPGFDNQRGEKIPYSTNTTKL